MQTRELKQTKKILVFGVKDALIRKWKKEKEEKKKENMGRVVRVVVKHKV